MILLVRDILNRNLLEGAKLAAGASGLVRPVQWVNFMEILDALESLQKGELLVTTGFRLDDESIYRDFIPRLNGRGVCAVAIQTGYYIREIPKHILHEADRCGLPVIELPASLTFSHIMHVLMDSIGRKGDDDDTDLLTLKNLARKLVENCPAAGQEENERGKRQLAVLTWSWIFNVPPLRGFLEKAEKVRSALSGKCYFANMECCDNCAVILFSLKAPFTAGDAAVELMGLSTHLSREDRVNFWAGISRLQNPENVDSTFEQAWSAHQMLMRLGAKKGAIRFEDRQFFEWLEYFRKKNNSSSFAYDVLKPVIAYDSFHRSDYIHTLRVYLSNECRISETSDKLFIHRHTLKNRLSRISELCGADFEEYYTRLNFSIALLIYDCYLS